MMDPVRIQEIIETKLTDCRALGDHMKSDIHALSLKTFTPAQWAQRA
jgi:acid stress-induced BolA-like protein IbaG/YrbA